MFLSLQTNSSPTDITPTRVRGYKREVGKVFVFKRVMSLEIKTTKDYQILEQLGEGLSSDIYKGIRKDSTSNFKQLVTIKVYKSKDFRKKFQNELKNLSRIQCEGIPRVLDWNVDGDQAIIFTEYIEGCDLEQFLKVNKNHLDAETKRYIVSSIYMSLCSLQENGMCHGDLKPSNVIVSIEGKIKLIDICLDDHGFVYATPDFAAPEVLLGHRPDHRSDLYSLGLIAEALQTQEFGNLTEIKAGKRSFPNFKKINFDRSESLLAKLVWNQKYGCHEAQGSSDTLQAMQTASLPSTIELEGLTKPLHEVGSLSLAYNAKVKPSGYKALRLLQGFVVGFLLYNILPNTSLRLNALPKISTVKLRSLKAWEVLDQGTWHNLPYNYTSLISSPDLKIQLRNQNISKILHVNVEPYEENKVITIDAR